MDMSDSFAIWGHKENKIIKWVGVRQMLNSFFLDKRGEEESCRYKNAHQGHQLL